MNQVKDFFEYIFNAVKIWVIIQPWQTGIRVRLGNSVKRLSGGIYFRFPYFDSVFIQENRLRSTEMPMQTLTSKDIKTVTLNGSFGYSIIDIQTLYTTLFHPEKTLQNIAMNEMATFIWNSDLKDVVPEDIEKAVLLKLKEGNYGIKFEYFKITNFAVVKTFILIQDQIWISDGFKNDTKV